MKSEAHDAIAASMAKITPPAAVTAASVAGWGVQEWMYVATIVYIGAQLGYLLWRWHRDWRAGRKA